MVVGKEWEDLLGKSSRLYIIPPFGPSSGLLRTSQSREVPASKDQGSVIRETVGYRLKRTVCRWLHWTFGIGQAGPAAAVR